MLRSSYLQPYREAAKSHGTEFGVTLWANPRSQQLRFEVFMQMCFLTGKRILDAGCSRGDFAAFLLDRDVVFEHYVGIDGLSEVIDYATDRQLPSCEFHCGDFVADPRLLSIGSPQVICISGSLNTMKNKAMFAALEAAWSAANDALIFNFLSSRYHEAERFTDRVVKRRDPAAMLDWAMKNTSHVALRQDYFKNGYDATILMRKRS